MLDIGGFRVLFDCPLDLSSLTIFSPISSDLCTMLWGENDCCSCHESSESDSVVNKRRKIEKPLDASNLIHAEPRYKSVKNLLLWDVSSIDIVLISSPMGMLGLPFLTGKKGFSAKVYATEAVTRVGKLMMEDLVTMNKEFRQTYGPDESGSPQWMKWEELELLPLELKEIALGKDGTELCGWMPLYSAVDVKDCIQKVHPLKYAEEACYNGTLILKAFSSGLEIGTCNWSITSPKGRIAYLSSSVFASVTAMSFDSDALQGSDIILYSDFTSSSDAENIQDDTNSADGIHTKEISELIADENLEEMEKLDFICSCSLDSVDDGGSVLIPVGRLGIIIPLLERIALGLESRKLKVPILIVSSVAEELMSFINIIPEWLCKQRQERLYSGQPLFSHMDLLNDKRLHLFSAIHSQELLTIWQEPCVVFCPHWCLRLGPVVHLLHRWSGDENSLLVMEEGVDANLALLPFKPIAMKVLQCSFLSGLKLRNLQALLKTLKPNYVSFPSKLKHHATFFENLASFGYYSENEVLHIPSMKDTSDMDIAIDLAALLHYKTLKQEGMHIARLKGEFLVEQGKHQLLMQKPQIISSQNRPVVHWGPVDLDHIVMSLQNMGINVDNVEVSGDKESERISVVNITEPKKAAIEVTKSHMLISSVDQNYASDIYKAICSILDCI